MYGKREYKYRKKRRRVQRLYAKPFREMGNEVDEVEEVERVERVY